MKRFYYTFGINDRFPFKNGYIIIEADNKRQANSFFKALFPNPEHEDILNCSFYYNEEQWKKSHANHAMKYFGMFKMNYSLTDEITCCFCGNHTPREYSHNAAPVKDGQCCSKCHFFEVLPARLALAKISEGGVLND